MTPPGAPRFELDVRDGRGTRRITRDGDRLRIGALGDNDVVLDGVTVSGRHAELLSRGGAFFVTDAGSLVGTLLNGVPVQGERAVGPGDEVIVGGFRLRVSSGDQGCLRGSIEAWVHLKPGSSEPSPRSAARRERAIAAMGASAFGLAALGIALAGAGGGWEILSPGELLPAHTTADGAPTRCADCHEAFGAPREAPCARCHGEAGATGRHRAASAAAISCAVCHVEHQRRAEIGPSGTRPGACERCHEPVHPEPGPPASTVELQGTDALEFSHRDHLRAGEAPGCSDCHSGSGDAPGTYEGCVGCHEGWRVDTHGRVAHCGRCHARKPAPDTGFAHDPLPATCAACHSAEVLYAAERPWGSRELAVGFDHETPEHRRGACSTCHPDVPSATRTLDVATVAAASPACLACHGPAEGRACGACHSLHEPRR